jgi:hypothetical protein
MPRLLNIGAGPVPPPSEFRGWDVVTLDIDESVEPDLCMDARDLRTLEPGQYEAVYASHVLEHFYEHEIDGVLWGMYHVLTANGVAYIRVPDARAVMVTVAEGNLDLDAVLYEAPVGPIRVRDVLWGWQAQVERSGQPYYGHRIGFCKNTLGKALRVARFAYIEIGQGKFELIARAYKWRPPDG